MPSPGATARRYGTVFDGVAAEYDRRRPAYPGELIDQACQVAGIGPDTWDDGPRANESLGAASTLVMRQLNLATEDLPIRAYKKRVKALAKHVMGGHRAAEDPIGFTVPGWLRT